MKKEMFGRHFRIGAVNPVWLAAAIYLFSFLLATSKSSASSLDTLPAGINSPMVRFGNVEGIGERYDQDGHLLTIGDYRSVVFNAENLSRMNARAQNLIAALDRFGTQNLGSNISYGVFKIEAAPQVQYTAPVYARGITNHWTLAVAVPLVHYKNNITFSTQNSNLANYEQIANLTPELHDALNIDLGVETQNTLRDRGYKQLETRDENFVGDVQVASLYSFWSNTLSTAQYSLTFNLPTGPKYDPDDLAALNIFGRTSVENKISLSRSLSANLEAVPYAALLTYLPDTVTARVPKDEYDAIPDQTTKEDVHRQVGTTATIGSDLCYSLSESLSLSGGYSISEKKRDQYTGDNGHRYDLLGQNTNSVFHRVNVGFSYSTVKSYLKKLSLLPAVVSFNMSDTVWGKNVERRTTQELNLMMFF